MAITTPSDVFVPQVVGRIATNILLSKNTLLQSGYVVDATGSVYESGGSTVTFPKWTSDGTLRVQNLPTDATGVTPDKVSMDSTTESVVGKIIAFQWTQAALEDVHRMADPNAFMAEAAARRAGNAVQSALLTEAATTGLSYTEPGGYVTYAGLLRARYENWGEYANDTDPLVIMHSACVYDLLCTDEAKKAGQYGGPSTVVSGAVQRIAGLNVLPLDSVPTTGTGAEKTYTNIILRRGALLLYMKRAMEYRELPVPNTDAWNGWFTFRFATHLTEDLPTGAIKYITKSSLDA